MPRKTAIPGDGAVKARRKASKNPTARSLALLRAAGFTVALVEHWNMFAGIRQDLFGIFDLLAMHPAERIVAVQVTTMSNKSKRLDKMQSSPMLNQWKAAGGRAQLHAWRQINHKDILILAGGTETWKSSRKWTCEVTEL